MGRPAKEEGTRIRDIAPTGVRLPPDLRDTLMREAVINRRSLSQEITQRLLASLEAPSPRTGVASRIAETPAGYGPAISDAHRQLVALFDQLTPDKQLALLTLLRR